MANGVQNTWSTTANSNATADDTVNWAEGQAPSTLNNSARAMMAALAEYRKDVAGMLVTGGSDTAYTLTTNEGLTLADGVTVVCRMSATNGATPTLNVDSTGAVAIQSVQGTAISTGALLSGGIYKFTYYASSAAWIVNGVLSAYRPSGTDVAIADGGTGQSTATAAFDALAPTTTRGDLITRDASNNGRLAVGAADTVLKTDGTDPSWAKIVNANITDATIAHGKLASGVTASQAQMEAGSATDAFVTPGALHHHPGVAKAWINYNLATQTLNASYGVSGVVRNSTGDFTVTFSTAFANTNYAWVGAARYTSTAGSMVVSSVTGVTKSTSAIRLQTSSGVGLGDSPEVSVAFYGDHA